MPAITELIRFITKANDISKDIANSWNQIYVMTPTKIDKTMPFNIETANSLLNNHFIFEEFICSKVNPRKTIVSVCVAATPPILATIGISIAK